MTKEDITHDMEWFTKEEESKIKKVWTRDSQHISYVRKLCDDVIDVCLDNWFCYPLLLSEFLEQGKYINRWWYKIRQCWLCDNNCIAHKDNPNPTCAKEDNYMDYIREKSDKICK